MKRFKLFYAAFLLMFFALNIFSQSEIEPNDSCAKAIKIEALDNTSTHVSDTIYGTIVSTKHDDVNNKPDYDRDYYYFTPSVAGTVKVNFNATGNMYFWIGTPTCDVWNIRRDFSKTASKTFHVNANERVNFLVMCRWPRSYQALIEFIPDNDNDHDNDNDQNGSVSETFDNEPNNVCDDSELIEELDGVSSIVSFSAKGKIRPNEDGEGSEGRDYFHFAPKVKGKITIKLTSDKNMWFAISNKGCFSPWVDSSRWNIQRGISNNVVKSFDIDANQRVDILALSYSNKDYDVKIDFTPDNFTPLKPDLTVSLKDEKDPVKVGEDIIYDLKITNISDIDALEVTAKAKISGDIEVKSIDGDELNCQIDDKLIECEAKNPLKAKGSISFKIVAKALKDGDVRVDFNASSKDEEDLSNNSAFEMTKVEKKESNTTFKTAEIPISSSRDDAIEAELIESKGYVYTGGGIHIKEDYLSNDIGVMQNDIGKFRVVDALRFIVDIPKEAKIKEAFIKFTLQDLKNRPSFEIYAEDIGNSAPFEEGDTFDITNRIKSQNSVLWSDIEAKKEEILKTPNLSSLLESVIRRDDWQKGNGVTFIIEPTKECVDNDCHLKAYDFDTNEAKAPVLVVKYELNEDENNEDNGSGGEIVKNFDKEPNNDCENAVVLTPLNEALDFKTLDFNAKIRPNEDGEGSEGRDYYTFVAKKEGRVNISLDSDKFMWFAITNKGCFSPWMDSSKWNIQRGITDHVEKSFEVKKGDKVTVLALSYSNKDYKVHIEFNPSN